MQRISTLQLAKSGIDSIQKNQNRMDSLIQQLSSGKRNDLDPIEKVQQLSYSVSISSKAQDVRNGETVMPHLVTQEAALSSISEKLIQLQEVMVAAQNSASQDLPSMKIVVADLKNDILSVANTRDAEGNYIFSGYKAQTQPFPDLNTYDGDQGIREIKIADNATVKINIPGEKVIGTNIRDAFSKIENFLENGVNDTTMIDSVQGAISDILVQTTNTGSSIKKINNFKNMNEDVSLQYQQRLNEVEGADMLKLVSDLSATKTVTEASMKSYTMIQGLSLFNYL